jgi:hypothetical protein
MILPPLVFPGVTDASKVETKEEVTQGPML